MFVFLYVGVEVEGVRGFLYEFWFLFLMVMVLYPLLFNKMIFSSDFLCLRSVYVFRRNIS